MHMKCVCATQLSYCMVLFVKENVTKMESKQTVRPCIHSGGSFCKCSVESRRFYLYMAYCHLLNIKSTSQKHKHKGIQMCGHITNSKDTGRTFIASVINVALT